VGLLVQSDRKPSVPILALYRGVTARGQRCRHQPSSPLPGGYSCRRGGHGSSLLLPRRGPANLVTAEVSTPTTVVYYGWRDYPYTGLNKCDRCWGWGCVGVAVPKPNVEPEESVLLRRTCPDCLGTGRDVPAGLDAKAG